MINYLALTIIGGILVGGGIIWDGYYGFVLFPYLSESPCEISVNSCDNMNKLLYHFNTFRGSLDRDTRIYMPTSLETEINWFDKACHVGWNYFKGTCSITLTDNSKQFVNYWLYGTATEMNWFDKSCHIGWGYLKYTCTFTPNDNNSYHGSTEELVKTANNQPNYLISGLCWLTAACAIFGNIYYNLDILKAVYTYIDIYLHNFLCMFDFPGFMIQDRSVMPLGPDFQLIVEHKWNFLTDPGHGAFRLIHLATYTLHHEYFWF